MWYTDALLREIIGDARLRPHFAPLMRGYEGQAAFIYTSLYGDARLRPHFAPLMRGYEGQAAFIYTSPYGDARLRQREFAFARVSIRDCSDSRYPSLQTIIAKSNFMARVREIANGALVPAFA